MGFAEAKTGRSWSLGPLPNPPDFLCPGVGLGNFRSVNHYSLERGTINPIELKVSMTVAVPSVASRRLPGTVST